MLIRPACEADAGALAQVFFDAVQTGAAPAYSQAQRQAWCATRPSAQAWAARLEGLETVVAEGETGPIGFMSARPQDGYIDLAFVTPQARGTGVASALYAVLENRLRAAGLTRLHTQASHMAKPFFERHGWQVLAPNSVSRAGQVLDNWIMEKPLRLAG